MTQLSVWETNLSSMQKREYVRSGGYLLFIYRILVPELTYDRQAMLVSRLMRSASSSVRTR